MSHEIRTPLNGVIGLNGLLRDTPLSPEQQRYVELARLSGESLLHLINDILDFSKIESGRLQLEPLPFEPVQVCNDAADLLSEGASVKGLILRQELDPALPATLSGDPARLRQILVNLLANAVKFTATGEICLRCKLLPITTAPELRWLRFEVQDTGIGMDADTIARLFRPFTQADVSTTRQYGGTGLGLAISRRLAELMGGRVGVDSKPGIGSTFWLDIPFEAVADRPASILRPILQLPEAGSNRGRVLVAEDNTINQLVAAEMLKRLGCRVDVVGNGNEAIDAVRTLPYDLVFLDCHMPELDGFDACRGIRLLALERHLPIVAMTASALKGDREKCLEAGMDDYLTKPVRMGDLQGVVEKWLG